MTDEQQERAISFALGLLDLVNNELVVGHWETFICKGASDILIELVKENIENVNGMTIIRTLEEPSQDPTTGAPDAL